MNKYVEIGFHVLIFAFFADQANPDNLLVYSLYWFVIFLSSALVITTLFKTKE